MPKQSIKKNVSEKSKLPFSISDFKNNLGFNKVEIADKQMEFIIMPSAFEKAINLPGFPMGYCSVIRGWSNTGKSTLKYCLIAACQRQGILPIIYETENNFNFEHAIECGMQAIPEYQEEEYVDEETGEVIKEKKVVNYSGDFIYFDSSILAQVYGSWDYSTGKQTSKVRTQAVIEDIAKSMNEMLDKQENGELPMPICFIWDSVGSIPSFKSVTSTMNNMYDAGAIQQHFSNLLGNRIPNSRKVNYPYTNTFVCVNKIWNDSMNATNNLPSIKLKGGECIFYNSRLILHMGGKKTASIKKLSVTSKGETMDYGVITKISVEKNHLPSPYNLTTNVSTLACVHNGLWDPDDMDSYKKQYIKTLIERLKLKANNEIDFSENDNFEYSECEVESE